MPPSSNQAPHGESSRSDPQPARKRPKNGRTKFSSHHRRKVLACARCHQRKIRCDGLQPACSNCVQADQPCNGILDGESKIVIPRSIAQYLQEKIRDKERLLRELGVDPDTADDSVTQVLSTSLKSDAGATAAPASTFADMEQQQQHPQFDLAAETARCFGAGLSQELLVSQVRFPYGIFLFASSHLPSMTLALAGAALHDDHTKTQYGSNPLDQIPRGVTERLVRNYVEKISPLYPYFDRQELWTRYQRVATAQRLGDDSASRHDLFVVSMMLATSIMTSKSGDSTKIALSSERIFQYAMTHSDMLYKTSFCSLQGTLMLIQYSYLMPRTASLWDTVGLAMRMALELGLHRDPEETAHHGLSPAEAERRRCVFWALYAFDRSICATSHRRLGIADDSISTRYPRDMDGTYFLDNVRFRRIQSELWTVNYLRSGLPLLQAKGSYDAWVADIEQRMHNWRSRVTTQNSSSPEWYDLAVWHGFVFLYRPCPRNPHPRVESLLKCFEAATKVAAGYLENAHSGFLKYSWHAVHHGFEAAMAMLYAIRHCKDQLQESYGRRKMLEAVQLFSSLFVLMSERWSQARASADIYERCKQVVLHELMNPGPAPLCPENDELDRMILPHQTQANRVLWPRRQSESVKSESNTLLPETPLLDTPSRHPRKWSQQNEPEKTRQLAILSGPPCPSSQQTVVWNPDVPAATASIGQPQVSTATIHQMPADPALALSSLTTWSAPSIPQQQLGYSQQQAAFDVGSVPLPDYSSYYVGHDSWIVPEMATESLSVNWDEVAVRPDQGAVDGMMVWSM